MRERSRNLVYILYNKGVAKEENSIGVTLSFLFAFFVFV